MIKLTRINGQEVLVNPDLVKTAVAVPDTMVTLTTGEILYVLEPLEEVQARFREYQRAIRDKEGIESLA